jgi:hypothetical protein
MLRTIADGNASQTVQWIALAVEVVLGIGLFIMGARQQERDREQDELKKKVQGYEEATHVLATKLVDERFRAISHQLNNDVQSFSSTLQTLTKRLEDGDVAFDRLGERGHEVELRFANKVDELKDVVRDKFATRQDLQTHQESTTKKFDGLDERLRQVAENISALTAGLENK